MKYSNVFSFVVFIFMITSCKSQAPEVLNGSIYIKLIDLGSLYKASNEEINSLKKQLDNFDESKNNKSEKLFYSYYKFLFEKDLIGKPYSLIKNNKGNIQRVFFYKKDYKEIESLLLHLDKNKEQINLSLKVKKINKDVYFASKIVSIKKVAGKTEWKK